MERVKVVCFVPESLPTHRPDVAALLIKEMPRNGVHTTVVGFAADVDTNERNENVITIGNGVPKIFRAPMYFWKALRLIMFNRERFDVVQVRDMAWLGLILCILSKFQKRPFSYWCSFLLAESRYERALKKSENLSALKRLVLFFLGKAEEYLMYKMLLPISDHVFAQSDAMKSYFINRNIKRTKITAVPMGVDLEGLYGIKPYSRRVPVGWDKCQLVCYLGTLDRLRELEVILRGFSRARKLKPDLRLLFIGDSDVVKDREFLVREAERLGISEDFHITGWIDKSEAWGCLKTARIAVSHVPRNRIFDVSSPTKPIEYMALGIPCLLNDSPDQKLLVESSGCGMLTIGTVGSYAHGLLSLSDNPISQTTIAKGMDYVSRYRSYEYIGKSVAVVYKSIADKYEA